MSHKQDLEPLLNAHQSQLNLLFDEGDNIDTKALAILGANLDNSPQYLHMDRETLLLQLLADTQYAIKHNSALNKQRLRFCIASILLTGLGFVILLAILNI